VSVLAKVQSCNYYRQFTKLSTTAFMQGWRQWRWMRVQRLEKHWLQVKLR
jgi:hypothetical protein